MGNIGSIIADACSPGIRYGKRLLVGIPDDRFARLAAPGGKPIQSNHPAFVIGHLCLYPVRVFDLLGQDSAPAKPPGNYPAMFSKDAVCMDDPTGVHYPRQHELTENFAQFYGAAMDLLRRTDDQRLLAENPIDNPMKLICPTLGALLAFYVTGHVMSHLGQLSAWRRMEGLPPA